jgi:tetratricopeptide (TPR) repeat protein
LAQKNLHPILKKKIIIIYILPVLIFSGCGFWTNFTTYFNLYYNASDLFNQAQDMINQQQKGLFSDDQTAIPQSANALLGKVIEKCSQILQFHAQSSYVDDALLMLGKCFYYQANYLKALRKFNEFLSTQPNSDLLLEDQLWIGKTQMKLGDYNTGLSTLQSVIETATKSGDDDILSDAYIDEIKYNIEQQNYSAAIELSNKFLSVYDNGEIDAQVTYELGEMYLSVNDYKSAISAFQKVSDYSPTYDIKVSSSIELGRAYRALDECGKAMDIFDYMRSKPEYSDAFDQLDYQIGLTLYQEGKVRDAITLLAKVDTAYTRTPSSGLACYTLGNIYENVLFKFDSAEIYYNKAASSTAPKEYLDTAKTQVTLLKKYDNLEDQTLSDRKEINYIVNPASFVKDSIAYYAELQQENQTPQEEDNFTTSGNGTFMEQRAELIQQMSQQYGDVIPNTPTQAPPDARRVFPGKGTDSNNPATTAASKKRPPTKPTLPLDTLRTHLAEDEFALGNLYFTEFNIPDSAYKFYMDVLKNTQDSSYQAKTLYSLGSYYLVKNDSIKADSLFNIIYNSYHNQRIVNAAANKINKPLVNFNYDPAEGLYSSAEKKLFNAKYDSSLKDFYSIFRTHRSSPFAAKALYATGWILENKLNLYDSAAVIYDTLTKEYSKTEYASAVLPELDTYNAEKAKEKQAIEDSLNAIKAKEKIKLDSLNALKEKKSIAAPSDTAKKIENAPMNKNKLAPTEIKPEENNKGVAHDTLKVPSAPIDKSGKAKEDSLLKGNVNKDKKKLLK